MSLEVVPPYSDDIRSDKDDSNGKNGASHSPKQICVINDSTQNHVRFSYFCLQTFVIMITNLSFAFVSRMH